MRPHPWGAATGSDLHDDKEEKGQTLFTSASCLLERLSHFDGIESTIITTWHHFCLLFQLRKNKVRVHIHRTLLKTFRLPLSQPLCFLLYTRWASPPTSRVPQFASRVTVLTYAGRIFRGPVLRGFICQVRRGSLVYVQSALLTGCSTFAAST